MKVMSHRAIIHQLSASSSACHGLLIITDNANTYKAQRDKNARELAYERGNYWTDASA